MTDNAYISGFMVTPQVHAHLQNMALSGLYGDRIDDVVGHLVMVGVQDALARGLTPQLPPAEFDEVEEAPIFAHEAHGPNCGCTDADWPCDKAECMGRMQF